MMTGNVYTLLQRKPMSIKTLNVKPILTFYPIILGEPDWKAVKDL
jgi:hypothetical protein